MYMWNQQKMLELVNEAQNIHLRRKMQNLDWGYGKPIIATLFTNWFYTYFVT